MDVELWSSSLEEKTVNAKLIGKKSWLWMELGSANLHPASVRETQTSLSAVFRL